MGGYACAASLSWVFERSHLCCLLCILTHRRSSAERLTPLLSDGGATHRVRRLVQEDRYRRSARRTRPSLKTLLHADENSFCLPAWNSALYCERCPDRMRDFFVLSYQASIETSLGAWFLLWDVWDTMRCWFCRWICCYSFFAIRVHRW